MSKRAESVDDTRQRIVDATIALHGTVGPAATTIAAIAEGAGVTRLTVYRHFPDDLALMVACSGHWRSQRQLPAPDTWARIEDPVERLRAGLADLYRYFREGRSMLVRIYRDKDTLPPPIQQRIDGDNAHMRDVLAEPFAAGDRRRLCAVVGHAVAFTTWWSLCVEHDLTDAEAVDAMTALVTGLSRPGGAVPGRPSPDPG